MVPPLVPKGGLNGFADNSVDRFSYRRRGCGLLRNETREEIVCGALPYGGHDVAPLCGVHARSQKVAHEEPRSDSGRHERRLQLMSVPAQAMSHIKLSSV
jgi:hypothetical protein